MLEQAHEPSLDDYDLALLQDDSERLARWSDKLHQASRELDAWLFGPWLGLSPETPRRLSAAVGCAVGETTCSPGGPAGARFARASRQLLERVGVTVQVGRVTELAAEPSGWTLKFETAAGAERPHPRSLGADAVVLAAGGIVSGAIELVGWRPDRGPRPGFELAFAAPAALKLDDQWVEQVSSLRGLDLQRWGSGALERVGVATEGARVLGAAPGLFAAGSLMAGRPRTMLDAVRSGIAAAQAALA